MAERKEYSKRADGRAFDELREMEAKVGIIKNAQGSAMFRIGKTVAYAAVYGPRGVFPKPVQNQKTGILRVYYNMMAFSGHGDRVRPGPSRRSKELNMVIEKSLLPVLDLTKIPKAGVELYIDYPQTDAGTRCAGICAAALALADAGFEMKDMVAAVSGGLIGNSPVVDIDYSEEAFDGGSVDMPIAIMPRTGEVTLVQMDGELAIAEFESVFNMAVEGCKKIYEVQKAALKAKYAEEEK